MRFLMDIIGLSDVFYIITAIAIFLCDIIGAFAFKLTADLMTTQEARDVEIILFGAFLMNTKYLVESIPRSKE